MIHFHHQTTFQTFPSTVVTHIGTEVQEQLVNGQPILARTIPYTPI
jgi:hypothetical protein